ncbi:MAG: MerR family transcriptional regulator [Gammaproteobacteria bacterium]|nr:MerR family transcriptional regulator [Gammaproteobacteria bacterium]
MLIASSNNKSKVELPPIPGKRYFSIGEVSDLCAVKPHVLRYWEQEFPQLKPAKRRGNRRYYQQHDVLMIREIRDLLYDQGFTIGGARQKLTSQLAKATRPSLPAVDAKAEVEAKASQRDAELVSKLCLELEDLLVVLS